MPGSVSSSASSPSPPPSPGVGPCRFQVLPWEQVSRLDQVMQERVPIHGRGNFPTLDVQLKDLVKMIKNNLEKCGVLLRDIRLNGGAASYILATGGEDGAAPLPTYNDVDLIFGVRLTGPKDLDNVKKAVLDTLLDLMPTSVQKCRMSACSLKEGYIHKMVKVVRPTLAADCPSKLPSSPGDLWSLIALKNDTGRHVDLKFVDTMKRQFEFSVDSFQILLDSLLVFYKCSEMPMSQAFYPTVVGESVYGDFNEALGHLEKRIIETRHPEQIRGGGLLKYVHLLVRDYSPADQADIKSLERYMCSRFFIDFGDINAQQQKLENYLANHFDQDHHAGKYDLLMTLYRVVDESTVCLMAQERRQTLALIEHLAFREYLAEQQAIYNATSGGPPGPSPPNNSVNKQWDAASVCSSTTDVSSVSSLSSYDYSQPGYYSPSPLGCCLQCGGSLGAQSTGLPGPVCALCSQGVMSPTGLWTPTAT